MSLEKLRIIKMYAEMIVLFYTAFEEDYILLYILIY